MKDTDEFEEIDVAMDIVKYVGSKEKFRGKFLVLKKAQEYIENRERYARVPWEIPGGKFELDKNSFTKEEIKSEAMRELKEETRIKAEADKTGKPYENTQEGVKIVFYPVLIETEADPDSVELDPEEHQSFEWIDEQEFRDRMTENEVEALKQVA